MQAHKLEVLVIDFDQLGAEGVKDAICTARYPNRCISPSVEAIQTVEIGPWSDDHPLNNSKTCEAEYKRLFERTTSPDRQGCCAHDSDCAVHNAPALPVGPCDCSLAAAAPHAQAPAEQQESITNLLSDLYDAGFDSPSRSQSTPEYRRIRDAIIAHIDAHTAAAVAKAGADALAEKARADSMESARDDAVAAEYAAIARAERAEAALAQPVDLSKLTRYDFDGSLQSDFDKGRFVKLSDVEQLIAASQQAAEPVAWQYRVRLGSGDWSEWRVCTYKTLVEGMRNNPLYELYDLVRAGPAIQQPQDERATAAEAKLKAIRETVKSLVGYGDEHASFISRANVLALFESKPQADESGLPG